MTKTYCVPSNTGLASTDRAVANRIARLYKALANEVTDHVIDERTGNKALYKAKPGDTDNNLADDVRLFRLMILDKLRADGWRINLSGNGVARVSAPKVGR